MKINIFIKGIRKIENSASEFMTYNHVKRSVKWMSGNRFINLPMGEVVVILLCRNMSHYLEEFYEYYKSIGVKYFIYADNDSNDRSLDIVSKWKNSVILSTELNFRHYQTYIRQQISKNYCSEGWRLAVDPDEIFDFVGSGRFTIQDLAKSLLDDGYTGLIAQMLDLVSGDKLIDRESESFADSISKNRYYSLENITNYKYFDRDVPFSGLVENNNISNCDVGWKFGGIRKEYFNEDCCLTKHPLFYYKRGVKPFRHPHLTTGLNIADFTALLKHYKFSGNYISREADLLTQKRISHGETAKRAAKVGQGRDFHFDIDTLYSDPSPNELSEQGFLVMSERAQRRYF